MYNKFPRPIIIILSFLILYHYQPSLPDRSNFNVNIFEIILYLGSLSYFLQIQDGFYALKQQRLDLNLEDQDQYSVVLREHWFLDYQLFTNAFGWKIIRISLILILCKGLLNYSKFSSNIEDVYLLSFIAILDASDYLINKLFIS